MSDEIGPALRELVPEPPREITMARLAAARSVRRRRQALVGTAVVLAVLAVVLPVTVLTVRLAAAPTAARPDPLVTTRMGRLTVTHPASWRHQPTENSQLGDEYLSTGRADPDTCDDSGCATTPLVRLGPDGVLVTLSVRTAPDVTLADFGGMPVTLGGRPGRADDGPVPACRAAQPADAHPRFAVQAGPGVVVSIDACVRGPDLDRIRAELAAMAGSVELDK